MSEYAIYGETLTATADAIRESLNAAEYSISSDTKSDKREIRWVAEGSVQILYREFVDYSDTYSDGIREQEGDFSKTVVAYSYLQNNNGDIVPVLYWTENPDPDTAEPLYYIGQEIVNTEICDKWRKIDSDSFDWDYDAKYYIYTNSIVNNNEIEGIDPVDFPNHIYTIASSVGISSGDDRYDEGYSDGYEDGSAESRGPAYDEGYENGRNDGVAVGSEQATIDWAPMVIHGIHGTGALTADKFTSVKIGDIVYTYRDILSITTKESLLHMWVTFTNNNPFLACALTANCKCKYVSGAAGGKTEIYTENIAVALQPNESKTISIVAAEGVFATDIEWTYQTATLQWSIA